MGKAKIVSHLGEGKYSVQLYHNIAKVEFKKARLNDNLTQVNADITTKEADKTTAESDLALASNNYQSLINAYADCLKANDNNQDKCKNQYNGMMERYAEFVEAQQLVNSLNQSLDSLYVIKQRLERDIAVLNNVHDEWTQMNIWCADLCDGDLGDSVIPNGTEVATIDIYSFREKKYEHWIVPSSYGRDNSYTESTNGTIKSSLSNNEYGFMFNWNMLGPQMAWSPAYRLATITSIDADNNRASVSYFDLTDEDGVNFNGNEVTTNIAIDYMLCNHTSFLVGDGVIISFCGDRFEDPIIIGFYANPRSCTTKLFAQFYSSADNTYFDMAPANNLTDLQSSGNEAYRDDFSGHQTVVSKSEGHILNVIYTIAYSVYDDDPDSYDTPSPYTLSDGVPETCRVFQDGVYKTKDVGNVGGFHLEAGVIYWFKLTATSGSITVGKYSSSGLDNQVVYNDADIYGDFEPNYNKSISARGNLTYKESDSTARFVYSYIDDNDTGDVSSLYFEIDNSAATLSLTLLEKRTKEFINRTTFIDFTGGAGCDMYASGGCSDSTNVTRIYEKGFAGEIQYGVYLDSDDNWVEITYGYEYTSTLNKNVSVSGSESIGVYDGVDWPEGTVSASGRASGTKVITQKYGIYIGSEFFGVQSTASQTMSYSGSYSITYPDTDTRSGTASRTFSSTQRETDNSSVLDFPLRIYTSTQNDYVRNESGSDSGNSPISFISMDYEQNYIFETYYYKGDDPVFLFESDIGTITGSGTIASNSTSTFVSSGTTPPTVSASCTAGGTTDL